MIKAFPKDRLEKRKVLLDGVERIAETLRASGPKSEELGTLAPEAVTALRENGMFRLKLCAEMGGAEADPVTEMLVLEGLAYNDLTSGWCTMVGATGIASLGTFLTQSGLDKVFANGQFRPRRFRSFPPAAPSATARIFELSGRWRFNSGIQHSEWVVGGTIVEGSEAENGGRPIVMFSAFPKAQATLYDNWRGVVGLRGTGSCDCSVENLALPEDQTFIWDLLQPKPRRGGPSYLFPPFAYVAKEHGSVAIGGARRALDELITHRHHHARHVSVIQARRAAGGASLHRRGRPEIAGGPRAAAPALRAIVRDRERRQDS